MLFKLICELKSLLFKYKQTLGNLADVEEGREPGSHLLWSGYPQRGLFQYNVRGDQLYQSIYEALLKLKGLWLSIQFQKLIKSLLFIMEYNVYSIL